MQILMILNKCGIIILTNLKIKKKIYNNKNN